MLTLSHQLPRHDASRAIHWLRLALCPSFPLRRDAESSGRLQPGDHHVCTLNLDGGPSLLVGTSAAIRAALE